MNRWLGIGLLVVGGCGEAEQKPSFRVLPPAGEGTAGAPTQVQQPESTDWSECGQVLPTPVGVFSASFALDGNAAVVGYADGSVQLHPVGASGGTLLREAAGDWQPVFVSPDGLSVAWRQGDDVVFQSLVDLSSSTAVTIAHQQDCGALGSFTPDGQHLLFVGTPSICLFDLVDGALVTQVGGGWSAGYDGALLVVRTGELELTSFDPQGAVAAVRQFQADSEFLGLSPLGDAVAFRSRAESNVSLLDVATGVPRATVPVIRDSAALFSPDGQRVALEGSLLATADGSERGPAHRQALRSQPTALSLDGTRTLILEGDAVERRAGVVEVATGAGLQLFGAMPRLIYGIAVSPDGERLVISNGHSSTGYEVAADFAASRAVWTVDTGLELAAEYSQDGSLVAISGDGRALVDAVTGVRGLYPAPTASILVGCFNAYFGLSSDNRWAAGGGWAYGVDVYDIASQTLLATLPSQGCNTSAAFSPDSSLLGTSSGELYRTSDFSRVWPAEVAKVQLSYEEALTGAQFLRDDRSFVASSCELASTVIGGSPFLCHNVQYRLGADDVLGSQGLADTIARPSFSRDGSWMVDAQAVQGWPTGTRHALPSGLTAAAFAPNGDVIAGDEQGVIHRFCK